MRIDEIDLYGNILISGSTGSEGQILTYGNDGGFDWGTASGGSGGPTSSYFKTSGYNYVICETVNTNNPGTDALTNGTNLQNAYNVAKTLDVGTKSATNRVVVLLMPGDYDLGDTGQFQLDTSFIDIVGISTNPYNIKLRSSTQNYIIQYTNPVDSALKNVYLYNSGAGGTYLVDDDGGNGDGSYLRWENLLLKGYLFSDGTTFGFSNIYGEFKNIKLLDGSYYFTSGTDIDGIFDNIEALGTNYSQLIFAGQVTPGSTLTGTFSNINFNVPGLCFYVVGLLSGYYENINVVDGSGGIFQAYSLNGTFKNIKVGGSGLVIFNASSNGDISGTYEYIKILDADTVFRSIDQGIYGTYRNIEIDNLTNVAFNSAGTMSGVFENIKIGGNSSQYVFVGSPLSGSFKNIEVGDVSGDSFTGLRLDGTFENITIGNVGNNAFKVTDNISGSFKNITIGDITNNNAFYAEGASGQILGTFDEIKIGNIASTTGYFFSSGATMSGTFSNIEIGDASEWATSGISSFRTINESIIGSYKNIKSGSTSVLFESTYDLNGTFENIEFSSTYAAFRTNSGSILGTYSNIKTLSQQTDFFRSNTDLIGIFENIEISSAAGLVFYGLNNLSGTFKNIKLGDLSGITGDVVYSGATALSGTFENIEVGNGNSSYDIFVSDAGNISGTFSNIKIGDGFGSAFTSLENISGYYKDITIGACDDGISGGAVFEGSSIPVGTTIDNLNAVNGFTAVLSGRLINSTIIDSANPWNLLIDVSVFPIPIVENCKLINDGNEFSITSINGGSVTDVQVLYTATNGGFNGIDTPPGDTLMTPNFNITDVGLT